MHRFYLPPEVCRGDLLTLSEPEAHHAAHVLRLRPGDQVTVLNGAGTEFVCRLEEVDRRRVTARVLERKQSPAPPFELTLIQAVPKGKIIESIIQKATELGVARVIPLVSERVISHLSDESAMHKQEKWQTIAVEAIKQCGAVWLPRIAAPVQLTELLARHESFDLALIGSLQPGSQHPRAFFSAYKAQEHRLPHSVCVWVGPEGDFTPEEVRQVLASGAHPITLGPLVLRVETAAVYCLSIVRYEMSASAT